MTSRPIYRQGDVLLNMVAALPAGARVTAVPATDERLVLAFGEQTGHAHAVAAADAELLDVATSDQVDRYLRVRSRTTLLHEEHAPIELEPGLYHVGIQRSFDPRRETFGHRVTD
jgi:hypothetical protein